MFNINIHCVVFGVNPALNKKCVLSTNTETLTLPSFTLEQNQLDNLEQNIINFLKTYIFVNDLELLPQHICMHHSVLSEDKDSINTVYGFIINYSSSINNEKCYWIDFDPMKEQKLSSVLLQTVQKLV